MTPYMREIINLFSDARCQSITVLKTTTKTMNITQEQSKTEIQNKIELNGTLFNSVVASVISRIQEKYFLIEKTSDLNLREYFDAKTDTLIECIISCVCQYFDIKKEWILKGNNRKCLDKYSNAEIRFIIVRLCRYIPSEVITESRIGAALNMDHTTVHYAIKKGESYIGVGNWVDFKNDYDAIAKIIKDSLKS